MRRSFASRLRLAESRLPSGFKVAIFGGWRAPELQEHLYKLAYADSALPAGFVSDPSADVCPHETGFVVDLTLSFNGQPLALGTSFDSFTSQAATTAFEKPNCSPDIRDLRRLLVQFFHLAACCPHPAGWWSGAKRADGL